MADQPTLFKNITRTKAFSGADLDAVHADANTFIETVLEADPDRTYAVRIVTGYAAIAGYHVVVIEYSYVALKTDPEA